jgi:hypothetical protein
MATQVRARDAMQFINEQDAATLERFIERLEFAAGTQRGRQHRRSAPRIRHSRPTARRT